MGNAQILSAEVVNCPHCNSSLKLNDSERKLGQVVVCPNCSKQFENKPILRAKKVLLPLVLFIVAIALCSAVSSSLPSSDKSKTSNQIADQEVAGIKTESDTPTSLQAALEETPTIGITLTTTPSETATPIATVKHTATAVLHTPIATVKPTAKPTPKPTSKPAPYACNCSKTCTQIKTCAEAQYQLKSCGCKQRDADKDGIACDGAPLHCQN